jgi:phage gpG-like protein
VSPIKDTDLGFRQIQSRIEKSGDLSVSVGVLSNESVEGSFGMVDLANVHEFGATAGNGVVIPERPAFRLTFDEGKDRLKASRLLRFDQYIMGQITLRKALFFLGDEYKNMVRATIQDGGKLKANAPATIKKKGSDLPLVDTGRLLQSITTEIRKG